ncbi:MAG TPA: potassium transporter Kup [Alphaproteobacteria bacterium]
MTTTAAIPDVGTVAPKRRQDLVLAALGVVFGDIGTSPLYAFRQSMTDYGEHGEDIILGILSLIAWSLTLVVTIKYVLVIMRADNRGEGGILALTALALRTAGGSPRRHYWIMMAGLVGAALFYGDGMITPAISVLSAVEGLKIATPLFEPYVIPISLVLLIGLFMVQRRGTAKVGGFFGPVMLVWFVVLALLGIVEIVRHPHILLSLNPLYGVELLINDPWRGFVVLGAVVLAVTGCEALYADMGHFGLRPLRVSWLYFVFPSLMLNYMGQGAIVLANPSAVENPFFLLAPSWALYPLVILASAATIIASQAVISGAFSITRQAAQLGYLPRIEVRHTSEEEIGQVYVPRVNIGLLVAVVILVLGFKSSDNLGAAYGIAVTGTMLITTILAFVYMRGSRQWSLAKAGAVFGGFLIVDLLFFGANLLKIVEGGWFPLVVAAFIATLMATWWRGRQLLFSMRARDALPLNVFVAGLKPERPLRVPGTAIFMTSAIDHVPNALLHTLKHYKVLHERVVLMTMHTEDIPHVPKDQRIDVRELEKGFYTVKVGHGFMDQPSVPRALALCRMKNLRFDLMETSFIVGREKLRRAKRSPLGWRQRLFILLYNNMLGATEFFGIPPNRAIEVGGHTEI